MRRFIITSKRFEGTAELLYHFDGYLVRIDLTHSKMMPDQVAFLTRKVPIHVSEVILLKSYNLGIEEKPFEVTVHDFLHMYPYARNTHLVMEYWPRMSRQEQLQAYLSVVEYRKYCERNKAWYKPKIAAAWLKAKEYLNDWKTL